MEYKPVKTFKEANAALCDMMHCGSDYPNHEFKVVEVKGKEVVLKGCGEQLFTLLIHKGKYHEYVIVEQSSSFEFLFHRKPTKFKVFPIIEV